MELQQILTDEQWIDPTKNPNKQCPICARQFLYISSLKNHFKIHLGETMCQDCGAFFPREDLLLNHTERVHPVIKLV